MALAWFMLTLGGVWRRMNTLQAVLVRTAASGHTDKELLLVQSKADIEAPSTTHATALHVTKRAIPTELLSSPSK
jgi:hypothetical protein